MTDKNNDMHVIANIVDTVLRKKFTMNMLFVGEFEGIEEKKELVEPKKELNSVMTDFVTNEFFPYAHNSEQFIKLVFTTFCYALKIYAQYKNINSLDLFFVYKGGNILRYVAYEVMHELSGPVADEIYTQYKDVFKKSDADFSIYINPKLHNYDEIFIDINVLSFLLQDHLRNEFMANLSKYFNFYKLNETEQTHLLSKYIEKLNETATVKDKLFEYDGTFTDIVFGPLCTHGKKEKFVPKEDFHIDYDYDPNSLYLTHKINLKKIHNEPDSIFMISSNQTLDFEKTGNRIKFSLVRTKVTLNAYFKKSNSNETILELLQGELIDVSVTHREDDVIEHYFENIKSNIDIYHIKSETQDFSFVAPSITYLIEDIERILFRDQVFPWDDVKYAKRIKRLLFFYFVLLLIKTKIPYDEKIAYLHSLLNPILNPLAEKIRSAISLSELIESDKQIRQHIINAIDKFLSDKTGHQVYPFKELIVNLKILLEKCDTDKNKLNEYIILIDDQVKILIKLFRLVIEQRRIEGIDKNKITEGTVLYGGKFYNKYIKYKTKYIDLRTQYPHLNTNTNTN